MTRRAIAGTCCQSWNRAQLTEHHNRNMAVESSTDITHDKTECGSRVAPAGDWAGESSSAASNTHIYSRAAEHGFGTKAGAGLWTYP